MNIEEILDDMDDLLDRSRPIPFAAHKAVIDADRMRELLNSAHLNIPAEIKRAKLIDSDCDRIINEVACRTVLMSAPDSRSLVAKVRRRSCGVKDETRDSSALARSS